MNSDRLPIFARYAGALTVLALVFAAGFGGGTLVSAYRHYRSSSYELVAEAHELVETHYLGTIPGLVDLERGMIVGLLEAIGDPYTSYQTPSQDELEGDSLAGSYAGIGAHLLPLDGGYALAPFDGGPAATAGIEEGDRLVQVDDLVISPETKNEDLLASLRGEPDSLVTVWVTRQGIDSALEFNIRRKVFPLPSVSHYHHPTHPQVLVLRLTSFSQSSASEVREGLEAALDPTISALVLDLRDNPGGLLDAAIEVADIFLDEGIILLEQDGSGRITEYRAHPAESDVLDIPLAVIVNGGTASAAEVVASALQSPARARVFGDNTFGKGSVQSIFGLSDGSSLHITTSRWLAPDGSTLDGSGLRPDEAVASSDGADDAALDAAVGWLLQTDDDAP